MPAPVCQSKNYTFSDLSSIQANTKYLGDATQAGWVSSGEPVEYQNTALLTMASGTVGTLLTSTHYVWYGKVGAMLKTSAGAGVVTAFILLSDTKDEIDFEFIGTDLRTAQSNFYSLGVTNCKPSNGISGYGPATNVYQIITRKTCPFLATPCKTTTSMNSIGRQISSHGPLTEQSFEHSRNPILGMQPPTAIPTLRVRQEYSCHCGLLASRPIRKALLTGLVARSAGILLT